MTPYVGNAGTFLINVLFGLYILAVMLRFLLQLVRADFYNPISQFLVQVTNPPLRLLRRVIPGWGGADIPAVVLMLALQAVELYLVGLVQGAHLAPLPLAVLSAAELLSLLLYVFLFSILVEVILSWVNPSAYNPATALVYRLNQPLLRPARQMLPPIGGLDLSPLLVIIALQLLQILLVAPIRDYGWRLMS